MKNTNEFTFLVQKSCCPPCVLQILPLIGAMVSQATYPDFFLVLEITQCLTGQVFAELHSEMKLLTTRRWPMLMLS